MDEPLNLIVSTVDESWRVNSAGSACGVRIVCKTHASGGEKVGQVSVEVNGGEVGLSSQMFSYQVSVHTHVQ